MATSPGPSSEPDASTARAHSMSLPPDLEPLRDLMDFEFSDLDGRSDVHDTNGLDLPSPAPSTDDMLDDGAQREENAQGEHLLYRPAMHPDVQAQIEDLLGDVNQNGSNSDARSDKDLLGEPSLSTSLSPDRARRGGGFARAKRSKAVSRKCDTCGKRVPFNPSGRPECTGCKEKSAQSTPVPVRHGARDDDAVDSVMGSEDEDPKDPEHEPLPCLQPGEEGAFGPVFPHSTDWDKYIIQRYDQHIFYNLNFDKSEELPDNASRESRLHRERCVLMHRFFDEDTYAETKDVHFRAGSTLADWDEYWAEERDTWTGRTLVHVYFNGKSRKSHNNRKQFWWKIKGIRENLNAYEWMEELNLTNADITYLLDCWVHTRFPKFYRDHAMTELIIAGPSEPDRNFNETAIRRGDFASGFQRILHDYVTNPPTHGYAKDRRLQSTPMIMRHDKTLNNNALRIWDLKPSKQSDRDGVEIWRTVTDPLDCWATGKMEFLRKQIQPNPTAWEPPEPENADSEGEGMEDVPPWDGEDDEGVGDLGPQGTSGNGGGGDDDDQDDDMNDAAAGFPSLGGGLDTNMDDASDDDEDDGNNGPRGGAIRNAPNQDGAIEAELDSVIGAELDIDEAELDIDEADLMMSDGDGDAPDHTATRDAGDSDDEGLFVT